MNNNHKNTLTNPFNSPNIVTFRIFELVRKQPSSSSKGGSKLSLSKSDGNEVSKYRP